MSRDRSSRALPLLLAFAGLPFILGAPSLRAQDGEGSKVRPTEKPFLWRIEGDTPSFLYGTIHLPDDRVLALPAVVREALDGADAVYTEIPFTPESQAEMGAAVQLPAGKTLKDVLPEKTYRRTEAYLASKGVPIAAFARAKVWVVAAQLPLLDYLAVLQTKQPLDAVVYTGAARAGKTVGALETVREQAELFERFTAEEHVRILEDTITELEKAPAAGKKAIEELVEGYLAGSGEKLLELMTDYIAPGDPLAEKFVRVVITDRNKTMTKGIVERLKKEPGKVHLFAVGALHYPGEEGIVHLLEDAGYTVTRLSATDAGKLIPAGAGAGGK